MPDESIGVAPPSTSAGEPAHGGWRVWTVISGSTEDVRIRGSMVATVPEALAVLSGTIGENVRRGLPDSDLVRRIWKSIRDLRDVHGVSEEAMETIVPESWRDKAFRAGEQSTSGQSIAEVLPTRDAESTSSSKAQYRLMKLVKIDYAMTGTLLLWNNSPRRIHRGARATHSARRRQEVSPRPRKEVNRDQVPPPS